MRTYIHIFLGVFSFFVSLARAQSPDISFITPQQRASFWANKMNEKLNLTVSQQKQVFNIVFTTASQTDSIRNNCGPAYLKHKYINEVLTKRALYLKKIHTPEKFSLETAIKEIQKRKLNGSLRPNSK